MVPPAKEVWGQVLIRDTAPITPTHQYTYMLCPKGELLY